MHFLLSLYMLHLILLDLTALTIFGEAYKSFSLCYLLHNRVKWVPCHHDMARPQVADGGDGLQMLRVAANILNKQSRRADMWWSSSLGVERGANKPPPP
jgi:hypothetical protein